MKTKTVFYAILAVLLFPATVNVHAQNELGLYNMWNVPQRIFENPSFIPDQKFYIGIPLLSGAQSAYALPFSYNDVIERDVYDSITFKVENFLNKLSKSEMLRVYSNIEVLSFGTRMGNDRFFLGFSIRERFSQHTMIPENLGNLLWYGNAAPQLFGKQVNIAPSLNMTAYDEWGLSFSGYALKRKMSWGGRLKYLSGRFNTTTVKSEFNIYTDTNSYRLHMQSDFEMRTSGIDNIEEYFDQKISSLVFPGNNGFGVDVGLDFQVTNDLCISASVLDIGFITWKTQNLTYVSHTPGKEFEFSGFTMKDFVDMLGDLDSFGSKVTDSILDLVHIDSVYGQKYTAWLPIHYNLGGTYAINPNHRVNLLLNGISWDHRFYPALSVSYNYKLAGILRLMASYSIFNNHFDNIGAGLSINAGPLQFYAVSDNIISLIDYRTTSNYSIRFGINLAVVPKRF